MLAFVRRHAPFLGIFVVAFALRAWKLDAIPNPCADEGNWTWIPRDMLLHRPVSLPPDARFVPMTFARWIEASFAHFGVSFASARGVLVAGFLLGLVAGYVLLVRLGLRRAALVATAIAAVHPWAVLWCRTVSVPYALAFATAWVGSLSFLTATRMEPGARRAVCWVVTAQVLFLGLHFSPLAGVPVLACAVWVIARPRARSLLRDPWLWVAALTALPHVLYVFRGVLSVAERGATRPSHQFDNLAARIHTYTQTLFGGLSGEATLRHFAGNQLPGVLEWLAIAAVIALCVFAGARVWQSRTDENEPTAARELRGFAFVSFALAVIFVPAILSPARPWDLHSIDAERYLFAMIAPFALSMGALAEDARRADRLVAAAFVLYVAIAMTRVALALVYGGGPDLGIYILHGGGRYRGWRTPRERIAVPWLIQAEVDRIARRTPATILVDDYAFHPIHFVNAETPYPTVDVTKFPVPSHPGQRFFFVLWSDGLFAPQFEPVVQVRANDELRARMLRDYRDVRRVRTFVQPNGWPLFEIWTGVQP